MVRNIVTSEIRMTFFEVSYGGRGDYRLTNLTNVAQLPGTLRGRRRAEFTLQALGARGAEQDRRVGGASLQSLASAGPSRHVWSDPHPLELRLGSLSCFSICQNEVKCSSVARQNLHAFSIL